MCAPFPIFIFILGVSRGTCCCLLCSLRVLKWYGIYAQYSAGQQAGRHRKWLCLFPRPSPGRATQVSAVVSVGAQTTRGGGWCGVVSAASRVVLRLSLFLSFALPSPYFFCDSRFFRLLVQLVRTFVLIYGVKFCLSLLFIFFWPSRLAFLSAGLFPREYLLIPRDGHRIKKRLSAVLENPAGVCNLSVSRYKTGLYSVDFFFGVPTMHTRTNLQQ